MKFVPGKKSAIGDKPATRRHERPLIWERLPFATRMILTPQDADSQKTIVCTLSLDIMFNPTDQSFQFLEIWNEDGVTAEPEEVSETEP
jgi:cohesin loading factor subunit SCC2